MLEIYQKSKIKIKSADNFGICNLANISLQN